MRLKLCERLWIGRSCAEKGGSRRVSEYETASGNQNAQFPNQGSCWLSTGTILSAPVTGLLRSSVLCLSVSTIRGECIVEL